MKNQRSLSLCTEERKTIMSHEKGGMGRSCAACKHQKKRCHSECPLLPRPFENVLNLYGVNNVLHLLKQVKDMEKSEAMESVIYEANARESDPVCGCYGIVARLQKDIERLQGEMGFLRRQIRQVLSQEYPNTDSGSLSSIQHTPMPASIEAPINPNQGQQLHPQTENDVNIPHNYVECECTQQPYSEPKETHESRYALS